MVRENKSTLGWPAAAVVKTVEPWGAELSGSGVSGGEPAQPNDGRAIAFPERVAALLPMLK